MRFGFLEQTNIRFFGRRCGFFVNLRDNAEIEGILCGPFCPVGRTARGIRYHVPYTGGSGGCRGGQSLVYAFRRTVRRRRLAPQHAGRGGAERVVGAIRNGRETLRPPGGGDHGRQYSVGGICRPAVCRGVGEYSVRQTFVQRFGADGVCRRTAARAGARGAGGTLCAGRALRCGDRYR